MTYRKVSKKQLAAWRARAAAKRAAILKRVAEYKNPDHVLTVPEWCALNSVSEPTGKRILNSDHGPAVTQLSVRRKGVTIQANRDWHQSGARGRE
jgi:hypothetical protein